ncbi:unnamed protein product [Sphagnum balticum]
MAEANGSKTQAQPVADVEELTTNRALLYPLLFGFAGSFVLRTAVVLGLPDIIARAGPDETLTVKQIAAQLKSESVNEFGLQRVLTALVNWQLFRCTKAEMSEMQYGLTPVSKLLVTENNPNNQAPVVLFQTDPAALAPWQQLHRHVLMHDWSDENCLKILNNRQKALPEKGKVLIHDFVLQPSGGLPQIVDMLMMARCDGGMERTEEQWRKLLTTAGFSTINLIELFQQEWLIEAFK